MSKVHPFLWFDTQAEEAANLYCSIFPNSKVTRIARNTQAAPGPTGGVLTVEFELDGQKVIALNGGPVVKVSANLRYATTAPTHAAFLLAARQAGVPVQYFVNRSGVPSGSTIGPIVAAGLAMPTVDVGNPALAMHSARELCGSQDPAMLIAALQAFLVPA